MHLKNKGTILFDKNRAQIVEIVFVRNSTNMRYKRTKTAVERTWSTESYKEVARTKHLY